MKARATDCPTDEQLRAARAGEVNESDWRRLQAHLSRCARCRDRDAALLREHETWLTRLRLCARRTADENGSRRRADASIPGYEMFDEIGRGGQGVVYRAVRRSDQRDVVIKLLREGARASTGTRLRFEREIELAAGLRHPNIVRVIETGFASDGGRYVVMERAIGAPFDAYADRPDVPLEALLETFAKVCDAVAYAHRRGVIHRDLKPSNIIVDASGEPRVLDFGLARRIVESDSVKLTYSGQITGTLAYLAPEQARGAAGEVDTRSDEYALGVMLYEALAGEPPYVLPADPLLAVRVIVEAPPSRSRLLHNLRSRYEARIDAAALATVTLAALAKEPEKRYQSVGELAADVRRVLAHEPIAARRDSLWALLRAAVRRHRWGAGVAAAFLLLLVASLVTISAMYARQAALRETAEQRFQQVRELARAFIYEIDPQIRYLPGAAPARTSIVTTGLNYLDALAAEAGDDAKLLHEVAGAYLTIGDVQGDLSAASLNDLQGALASYDKARGLLERALKHEPGDFGMRRALALAYNKIGDAQRALEQVEPAQQAYQQALSIIDSLAAERPDDPEVQDDLATTHERLGVMAKRFGRLAEAEQHFRTTLRISEQLLAESPEVLARLRGRATVYTKLAELHYLRGDRETALRYYERFRETAKKLAAADPANMVYRIDQAIGDQWVGIIRLESGDAKGAIAPLRRSVANARSLLAEDPTIRRGRVALTASLTRLGEALLATNQIDEALNTYEELLAATKADRAAYPNDPVFARRFAVAHYKLAEYHARRADAEDAAPAARRDHLLARLSHLEKCRAVFLEMREAGKLSTGDANVPEELAAEIDSVREALAAAAAEPPATSQSAHD